MDCVSDTGDVFIGYAATLRYKRLTIDYASAMRQAEGGGAETKTSARHNPPPAVAGDSITWGCEALGVAGTWNRLVPSIEHTLYETKEGSVVWSCLFPHAMAEVVTPGWPPLVGRGYVERLTSTIPVWKLPIDQLRWGRFHSPADDLVWIDWRGPVNLQLVYLSGELVERARVADDAIALAAPAATLSLDRRRVLRDGPLIETALSSVPRIQDALPFRSLHAHETKWCSRATFTEGKTASTGWALHEIVRWPASKGPAK
jgi:hypothetical protein